MKAYRRFLPQGDFCEPLADLFFFHVGDELDFDLELAIPAKSVEPVKLGKTGDLGWTSWLAPDWAATEAYRCDARSIRPNECGKNAPKPRAAAIGGRTMAEHQSRGRDGKAEQGRL